MEEKKEKNSEPIKEVVAYLLKWIAVALIIGALLGAVGAAFVHLLHWADHTQRSNFYGIFLLPVAGVMIVFLYQIAQYKDKGSNIVLSTVREQSEIPFRVAPLIFIATVLTQLSGGSAGKEGAALQLGGSLGNSLARLFRMKQEDKKLMVMCGMSACFSAVFGTPITAAVFSIEVASVGIFNPAALVPCVCSAVVARYISSLLGVTETVYTIELIPELSALNLGKMLLLGLLCGLLAILFCQALHYGGVFITKYLKNPYLRILAGSVVLIGIFLLEGSRDFAGAGFVLIDQAMAGEAKVYGFLLKILVTVITLKCGFKGGEIVPTLAIGAAFGGVVGPLLGLSPSFGAALCMIGLFCGTTNCPWASAIMAFEMFGLEGAPYYMIVLAVSFAASGYYGLYKEQIMVYSKYTSVLENHRIGG